MLRLIKQNGMIDYNSFVPQPIIPTPSPEDEYIFKEALQELTEISKQIVSLIFSDPLEYLSKKPREARGIILKQMKEKGHKTYKIMNSFKEIKSLVN